MIYSRTIKTDLSTSSAASESEIEPIIYHFELGNGNEGKKTVIEPMLRERDAAQQRAIQEFLDNGFPKKYVDADTWRTDLLLNEILVIKGIKYKVISIDINSDKVSCKVSIRGVHYG